MCGLHAFLLTTAFAAVIAQAATPAPGSTFTTKDGSVSFWTPSLPKKSVDVIDGEVGDHRRTLYTVSGPSYLILVSVLETSGVPTTGDEEHFLGPMVDDLRNGLGTSFVLDKEGGRTDLKLDPGGLKGVQLRGTVDLVRFRARAYIGACRLYLFQITHAVGDEVAEQLGERLFSSAAINDPVTRQCIVSAEAPV